MTVAKAAISLEVPLLKRIDRAASELSIPRSRLVAQAAEEFLDRRDNARLLARINEAHALPRTEEELALAKHRRAAQARRVQGEW